MAGHLRRLKAAEFVWLFAYSVLYFVSAHHFSSSKLLWFDEFFPYYISQLRSLSEIWNALSRGVDPSPPLGYVLTRAAITVFGAGPSAARLGSTIGFWLMSVCIYAFVRRRCGIAAGLLAMAFPVTGSAYLYAFDAKPYALVLGYCAAAMLSWQLAGDGRMRKVAICVLMLSLAAAVSTHYYAVLIVVPLMAGEAVRVWRLRRLDTAILVAIIGGLTPLLFFRPLIAGSEGFAEHFWSKRVDRSLLQQYLTLLGPSVSVVAWIAVVPQKAATVRDPCKAGSIETGNGPFLHEYVAAGMLCALPIMADMVGKAIGASAAPR